MQLPSSFLTLCSLGKTPITGLQDLEARQSPQGADALQNFLVGVYIQSFQVGQAVANGNRPLPAQLTIQKPQSLETREAPRHYDCFLFPIAVLACVRINIYRCSAQ